MTDEPIYSHVEVPVNQIGIAAVAITAVVIAARNKTVQKKTRNFLRTVRHPIDTIFKYELED